MTAAVVAHRRADVFGDGVEVADEVFDIFSGQVAVPFERGVEAGHIGIVVLGVVNLHGTGIYVRL